MATVDEVQHMKLPGESGKFSYGLSLKFQATFLGDETHEGFQQICEGLANSMYKDCTGLKCHSPGSI